MSEQQKKIIPKFKKKLQGFLSDESGKITKEDVLKMGLVAMGVAGMIGGTNPVEAYTHTSHTSACNAPTISSNTVTFGNLSGTPTPVNNYYPGTADPGCVATNSRLHGTIYTTTGIAPYTRTVNGHANGNATIVGGGFNGGSLTTDSSNTSHSSHSNFVDTSGSGSGDSGSGTGDSGSGTGSGSGY